MYDTCVGIKKIVINSVVGAEILFSSSTKVFYIHKSNVVVLSYYLISINKL